MRSRTFSSQLGGRMLVL
ncbi:unnamed protein product [Linum tenue]|uniref:Uncharacterized protein n=1 Tax=Linum tenue TaxID=586396 RepID=A0AAV0PMF6_9ROSI|nr:unnamed protein product [Linum tenue]